MKKILLFVILLFFSCKEFNYSDIRRKSSKVLNSSDGSLSGAPKISFVDSLNDDQKEALFFIEQVVLDSSPDKFNQILNLNENKIKEMLATVVKCLKAKRNAKIALERSNDANVANAKQQLLQVEKAYIDNLRQSFATTKNIEEACNLVKNYDASASF
ncbi:MULTISPECIES: BBA07 family lipoprotein [Borreliella]|uniref:Putative chpAI protein n=2 Tax=Borreliella TaxID=64895 RepID=C0R846_BORVA|nr:BBA07 family lipoprotein [Borreliella valaisiana]AIJ30274.1 chpAI protein [Borreliella valaisiana Tom4006]ACN52678.1 putative chpAI protein [Borreliella valaisiana VS116]WKC76613.1 BBA07 family lipoprotein [Borreliella valaisiana]WLN25663.1 BBA07 family lipoprotein [Borreliella valaisiana]WVN14627.1 BBA07 family lipoprotein [Borreliella valaisiana]